jgi:hypothetical protein
MRRTTVNNAAIAATLTRRFATDAIMGIKRLSMARCNFSGVIPEIDIWRAATLGVAADVRRHTVADRPVAGTTHAGMRCGKRILWANDGRCALDEGGAARLGASA